MDWQPPRSLDDLPTRFRSVRYVGARHPAAAGVEGVEGGANCQQYAYEFLRHHGLDPRPLRSSELFEDVDSSERVTEPQPLDLLLFNDTASPWGAHVAVYVGNGRALHLSREVGTPAIWALDDFLERDEYRVLVGIKRITRPAAARPAATRSGRGSADGYVAELRALVGTRQLLLPSVSVLVRDDTDRILLGRHRHNGLWGTIGGLIEPGETPQQAALREAREETGLEVTLTGLLGAVGGERYEVTYPNGDRCAYVSVVYGARIEFGTPVPDGEEITELEWFHPAAPPVDLGEFARSLLDEVVGRSSAVAPGTEPGGG